MKKELNKKKLIIIVVVTILIIGLMVYIIIDKMKEKEEDKVALTLKDNLTVEYGAYVKVSDFIEDLQGELINDYEINTGTLGEKEVAFDYKSIRKKNKAKSFTINIIDTTEPLIYMSDSITVGKGYNKELTEVVLSGDNCTSNPDRWIEGDYDLNTPGTYHLKFKVRDESGNEAEKDFTLRVISGGGNASATTTTQPIKQFSDCLEKYKDDNNSLGIDVSKWQGEIDWDKVKNAGAEFAFIRIGYQNGFDGENEEDGYFRANIEGAKKAGLKVGGYFFTYAKTKEEVEEQADWISDKLEGYDVDLPIAFDWESWTSFAKCNLSFYDINNMAKTYIRKLEERGYKGTLYSSKTYLQKIWYAERYENVWLAHYTDETDYDGKYNVWQMCDTGRIDGIKGAVDIDVMYKE